MFNKKIKQMKKNFVLSTLLLLCIPYIYGQSSIMTITENFDGNTVPFTSIPANAWSTHTAYAMSFPNSYRSKVPTYSGDTVILETPNYIIDQYPYVRLRFNHICKISPSDIARVEYRINMGSVMGAWQPIPRNAYMSSSTNYALSTRFNAASYSDWQANDSLAIPAASWWKEEVFDLSHYVGGVSSANVQFRFLLIHGSVEGTQISYGWLLDNFEIKATYHELNLPAVAFLAPFVKDTIYNGGPYDIYAKVATRTSAPIEQPSLIYTAVNSQATTTDTILMVNVQGDSLWKATIPPSFLNTKVSYSIRGKDSTGNSEIASSWYIINQRAELVAPFVKDTIYNGGPWNITAKIKPRTSAHIDPPSLIYTAVNSRETITDTIPMTNISGDSLWQATIPEFFAGTKVSYSVIDKDTIGNYSAASSWYVINQHLELLAPFVKDTIYTGGPCIINAKIKPRTSAHINPPSLIYSAVNNRWTITDTIPMTNVRGDSLWRATIPEFFVGTKVSYSVINRDTVGNSIAASSWYVINQHLELLAPFVMDTVYSTGPFSIHAKAIPKTSAHIKPPSLIYTAVNNQETVTDTIAMTNTTGDSLWEASIPQFVFDTKVSYSVAVEDTVGNYFTTSSWYMIKQPTAVPSGFKYAGDTNSTDGTDWVPYTPGYDYSWSRALVLASEIDLAKQGGLITSIAYFPTFYDRTLPMSNQSLYFKAVEDESITTNSYIEPLADGATLVWQGTISPPQVNQWMDIELNSSFMLPSNSNLLVYWINNDGIWEGEASWKCTSFPEDMIVENEGDENFPTSNGYLDSYRPNMRFYVIGNMVIDYSTAINSIDIADTIFISPDILQTPIVSTIKNKGTLDLDSALVSYSINSSTPTYSTLYFNPALPSESLFQDTIAYYTPRINQFDTIVIKIELPNGEYDVNEWDDELTKIVYGACDIQMSFVNPITDTIYKAGPFDIAAQIASLSSAAIGNVSLYVQTIESGNTEYDMIPMLLDPSDNLFKCVIPAIYSGGDIFYSITLTDFKGNMVTIANNFHVQYLGEDPGYVIIGERTSTRGNNPYAQNYDYGWSRNLYLGSEINPASTGKVITSLAWSVESKAAMTRSPQSCYLKAVPDTSITSDAWENPVLNGSTLVWRGSLRADTGWNEINFNKPFVLPKGQNLMVYWIDSTGASNSMSIFRFHSSLTVNDMAVYDCEDDMFPRHSYSENGSLGKNRPDIRFYIHLMDNEPDSNAVALNSILIPSHVNTGTSVDVKVVIENTGLKDLDSCRIYWKRNGVQQPPLPYYLYNNGPLEREATDTVFIGSYVSVSGQKDEIEVWVSMPNGVIDTATYDDTLRIRSTTCGNTPFSGNILIGTSSSAQFETISDALSTIAFCGMSDKAILELEDGYYPEDIDFTILNDLLTVTDTIELRSLSGNATDVTVESRKCVVRLGSSNNITLKNITLNVIGEGFGIYLTDSCNNIEINGCTINLDTTIAKMLTNGTTHVGICKFNDSKSAHNVRILNNTVTGGYNAVYLYGGPTSGNHGTGWVLDSNTIRNAYSNGVFMYYTDIHSISNNTVISMSDANFVNNSWIGFMLNYCNAGIIGNNRINALKHPFLLYPRAMIFTNLNSNTIPAKIYNNEILMSKAGTLSQSIFTFTSSSADIYHNSIYIKEVGESRCYAMDIYTTYPTNIRNNNVVMTNSRTISINDVSIISDYNNFHTGGSVFGYYRGTEVANFASWKTTSGKDANSFNVLPLFTDINMNMEISDSWVVFCPRIPDVPRDINGNVRTTTTLMGAYTVTQQFPNPEAVIELHNWSTENIVNQVTPVEVLITNLSSQPLEEVVFEWTLNGGAPVSYTWNAPTALPFLGQEVITVGSFPVSAINDVKAWITTLNTSTTFMLADTLYAHSEIKPLAEFVAPFVGDTISSLSFDVHTLIRPYTGATVINPRMNLQTIVNDSIVLYDTIDMLFEDGIWITHVPKQSYYSTVIYSLMLSDTINNMLTIMDSTYIQFIPNDSVWNSDYNLSILSIEKLVADSVLCSGDYGPVQIILANTGSYDYDFSVNPITLGVEVTNPIPFYKDSILNTGSLLSGQSMLIELTDELPIIIAGQYDVKAWLNSGIDVVPYDDTLTMYYVSGKFGLPVDENFSSSELPLIFESKGNTNNIWNVISQGTGTDTVVKPQQGTGMLAFSGTPGAISTLFTRQLDLSRAIQPSLTFWYFHDTIPCDDYTNVRITVDGGSYTTLLSLSKYNPVYGWKEYNLDLPTFAINQCVILIFDAMESLNGDVTQYIDRIRITAKQEIAITDIFIEDLSVCSLENKEWKVVLSNKTAPALDYSIAPVAVTLELVGTSYSFTDTVSSGILNGFSSDTLTLASDFDLAPGRYVAKASISSIFGEAFLDTIIINPALSVAIKPISGRINDCASANITVGQQVVVKNTGNMSLSGINLYMDITSASYTFSTTSSIPGTLLPGDSITHTFDDFITPWDPTYYVNVVASLGCDSVLVHAGSAVTECVDIEDLYILNINNPSGDEDKVGEEVNIAATITNRSDINAHNNINIYAEIRTMGGELIHRLEENISYIGFEDAALHSFREVHTIPADTAYMIKVYIENRDNYAYNDTMTIIRKTDYRDINGIERKTGISISMSQNIPNPANSNTIIRYTIPESGEVIFRIHSMNGQLLYNKAAKSESGTNSIEINTSTLSAGIYVYSMEFNGQRITKRMSIKR